MVRTSPLKDNDAVLLAVDTSKSKKEILEKLGLRAAGGNYKALNVWADKNGVVLPKWIAPAPVQDPYKDEDVFVEHSSYVNRSLLKKRLYKSGVPEICVSCGVGPEWNGRPLTLTLEHKNGVWNDNRKSNLEILCPNCHSQTATFAGSAKVKPVTPCPGCGNPMHKKSTICVKCNGRKNVKASYPEISVLLSMVAEKGYSAVGRSLGVSDVAVRKYIARNSRI